jgi:uncharacterized membrane protein YkoI
MAAIAFGKGRRLQRPPSQKQENDMRILVGGLAACVVAALVLLAPAAQGQDKTKDKDKPKVEKLKPEQLPEKVRKAVDKRFPGATFRQITREIEEGNVVFDIELTLKGRKYEMDVKEDGTVIDIEQEVSPKDLPRAVTQAVEARYPKSTIKEVMEISKVNGTQETRDHYEVILTTADGQMVEVEISLTGKFLKGGKAEPEKK